jgi:hypothetical protein
MNLREETVMLDLADSSLDDSDSVKLSIVILIYKEHSVNFKHKSVNLNGYLSGTINLREFWRKT